MLGIKNLNKISWIHLKDLLCFLIIGLVHCKSYDVELLGTVLVTFWKISLSRYLILSDLNGYCRKYLEMQTIS